MRGVVVRHAVRVVEPEISGGKIQRFQVFVLVTYQVLKECKIY